MQDEFLIFGRNITKSYPIELIYLIFLRKGVLSQKKDVLSKTKRNRKTFKKK